MSISAPIASFAPPRLPRGVIRRTRLLRLLHERVDQKLIVVAAGAGYGKTTLLAHFAEEVDFPVCWFSLSPWSQDFATFVESLIWAIQSRFPSFGHATAAQLKSLAHPSQDIQALVGAFLKELESHVSDYLMLVLDDYQQVEEDPLIADFLDKIVPHLPEQAHFLLASRSRPTLRSLPRLVANREAFFLPAEALKFTATEAKELLEGLLGSSLSEAEAIRLNEHCEGWPAALVLAGNGHGVPPPLAPNGSFLLEYLEEELFSRQDYSLQSFLVRTSVFPVLLPQLCDELLGTDDAQAILRELTRRSLVSEEVCGCQPAYRYHALLREFLLRKLEAEAGRQETLELGNAAGTLLEQAELWQEALDVYCQFKAYGPATRLLARVAEELALQERWALLLQALGRLPEDILRSNTELAIRRAEAANRQGNPDAALELLDTIAARSGLEDDSRSLARVLLEKSIALRNKGYMAQAEACCQDVLDLLSPSQPSDHLIARAHHNLGLAKAVARQFPLAIDHLDEALKGYESLGDIRMASQVHNHLGTMYTEKGNPGEAIAHFNQALRGFQAVESDWGSVIALSNLGNAYFTMAEYELAEEVLGQAVSRASSLHLYRDEAYALVTLADVQRACGRYNDALRTYLRGTELARQCQETRLVIFALEGQAQVALWAGNTGKAEAILEEACALARQHNLDWHVGALLISRAMAARQMGLLERARDRLVEALTILEKTSAPLEQCRAHLHLAYIHLLQGSTELARQELQEVAVFVSSRSDPFFLVPDLLHMPGLLEFAIGMDQGQEIYRMLSRKVEIARRRQDDHVAPTLAPAAHEEVRQPAIKAEAFGVARVMLNGQEVTNLQWRSNKAKELFYLLAHFSRRLTKEEVIAALWPDVSPEKGESNFKSNLFRARRALYAECFVHENGYYRFAPRGEFEFDVAEFLKLLEVAERLPEDAQLKPRYLEEAISLYQGPFLPEFYSEWCELEREKLEARCLQSLSSLAEHCAREGNFERAASLCQEILDRDPYNEAALGRALVYFVNAGNLPAAAHCFRRYQQLLERELGSPPSARIQQLYLSLLEGTSPSI